MVRTEDIICRYGGEEFAVIAPGTDYEGGLKLGLRLLERVGNGTEKPSARSGGAIKVTVSVGFATVKPEPCSNRRTSSPLPMKTFTPRKMKDATVRRVL